jgi:hypothetical protein
MERWLIPDRQGKTGGRGVSAGIGAYAQPPQSSQQAVPDSEVRAALEPAADAKKLNNKQRLGDRTVQELCAALNIKRRQNPGNGDCAPMVIAQYLQLEDPFNAGAMDVRKNVCDYTETVGSAPYKIFHEPIAGPIGPYLERMRRSGTYFDGFELMAAAQCYPNLPTLVIISLNSGAPVLHYCEGSVVDPYFARLKKEGVTKQTLAALPKGYELGS